MGSPAEEGDHKHEFYLIDYKAFTGWCNTHLIERLLRINDFDEDFKSGVNLYHLLEVISQKKIGGLSAKPTMKLQRINNLVTCLNFIKSEKIQTVNIGAEDIEAGNVKVNIPRSIQPNHSLTAYSWSHLDYYSTIPVSSNW